MGGLLEMSEKELDRYHILRKVLAKELTQLEASSLLRVTDRQVRNLLTRLKGEGKRGLISKHRNKKGNHCKPDETKRQVLALIREQYPDFGPTLATEKLRERDEIVLSKETLRQWMIAGSLWVPRAQRPIRRIPRLRRPCFGELLQTDGSHHRWFGDDGPMVNLTVLIDDATSRITGLHFSENECLVGYFSVLKQHLKRFGRPRALYSDRHSIFYGSKGSTQMNRALKELDIESILANSPQAKGRVERANRILQDRLLKELRLREIKSIEEANVFTKEYLEIHNANFSKKPMSDFDAHRPLDGYDLECILTHKETRTFLSSGIFQYKNTLYEVQGRSDYHRLKGRKIQVCETARKKIRAFLEKGELKIRVLGETEKTQPVVMSRKELEAWVPLDAHRRRWSSKHPWRESEDLKTRCKRMAETGGIAV